MTWRAAIISWVLAPLLGGYLGILALAGGSALLLRFGPKIEAAFSPVVRFEPTTDITRNGNVACFVLHIQKLHSAVPIGYYFPAQTKTNQDIDTSAYMTDANHKPVRPNYIDHPVGTKWSRYYCFNISTTIAETQDITVSGFAVHHRHALWDSRTEIPAFVIPALVKLSTKPVPAAPG